MSMETDTDKKSRLGSRNRKIKCLDWVMQWFTATHDCAFCGIPLSEGYNPRDPGKCITLHHTEGSREEDRWDDIAYVSKMVPAHSTCHRSYHLTLKHKVAGKNYNKAALENMEANLTKVLNKQAR